jgi:hypothetical protein
MILVSDKDEIEQMANKLTTCKASFKLVFAELLICSHFNQLAKFDGGFVGWLRWDKLAKDRIYNGEFPMGEIKSDGTELQIVSLFAPKKGMKAVKWLSKLGGIKSIFGNTGGRWREVKCLG